MTDIKKMIQPIEVKIDIPTFFTDPHSDVYQYWARFRKATLLHVDAHHDLWEGVPYVEKPDADYYKELWIGGFICPAFHYGIVSKMYWLNPHSPNARLEEFNLEGKTRVKENFSNLEKDGKKTRMKDTIEWVKEEIPEYEGWDYKPVNVISEEDMSIESPFILGVDLAAFSCPQAIPNVPRDYDGINGWEQRMDETFEMFERLKRPDLITITRSQHRWQSQLYVPRETVDDVTKRFVAKLNELYR